MQTHFTVTQDREIGRDIPGPIPRIRPAWNGLREAHSLPIYCAALRVFATHPAMSCCDGKTVCAPAPAAANEEQVKDAVKDYYGKKIKKTDDLITSACVSTGTSALV